MPSLRIRSAAVAGSIAIVVGLLAAAPAGAYSRGDPGRHVRLVCRDGIIPPGTYGSIVVTGDCGFGAGDVVVTRDIVVGPRASLWKDWNDFRLVVGGNVTVGRGSVLSFGCGLECMHPRVADGAPTPSKGSPATTSVSGAASVSATASEPAFVLAAEVAGSIRLDEAYSLLLEGSDVGGDVVVRGGGATRGECLPGQGRATRSGVVVVSEVNIFLADVGGSIWIGDVQTCSSFVGFSTAGRDVVLVGNRTTECAPHETLPCRFMTGSIVGWNTIGRDLVCHRNAPAPVGLDRWTEIGGRAVGQCAAAKP